MLIQFVEGDFGGDGHERYKIHNFESSHSRDGICRAYAKGTELLGFDLIEDFNSDYEEQTVTAGMLRKLGMEESLPSEELYGYIEDDDDCDLEYDWEQLICCVIQIGNPDITLTKTELGQFEIGGYGNFYG